MKIRKRIAYEALKFAARSKRLRWVHNSGGALGPSERSSAFELGTGAA